MYHILVLEDNEDDLALFRRALKKTGIDLSTINIHYREDGEEGLAWLNENGTPELIITDNEMFPMCGVNFIQNVRQNDNPKSIPIAMLTGSINHEGINTIKEELVGLFDKNNTNELCPWIKELIETHVI